MHIFWKLIYVKCQQILAETINVLFKTEFIRCRGPWCSIEEVEFAGWIGAIIEDCWKQSAMSPQQNLKRRIIAKRRSQLMRLDSTKIVPGNTEAIQTPSIQ